MLKLFPVILASGMCLQMPAQIPAYVPVNGLQGYWPFSGNANDYHIYLYHGTVNGAVLTTDRFGAANSAYSFNGSSDFIYTTYSGILGTHSRAISFWAKTSEGAFGMAAVAWGGNDQATRFNCMFNYVTTGATIDGGFGAITYNTPSPVPDGLWHHYVFQFSNAALHQVEVYQDGVPLAQAGHSYNQNNILNTQKGFDVHFGRIIYSPGHLFFNGDLDDIGIWDRTLSESEISNLYNSEGLTSNLIEEVSYKTSSVLVFPNPATDIIQIRSAGKPECRLRIYSSAGILLKEDTFNADLKFIDVSEFPSGLYFIQIKNKDVIQYWRSIIIN